MEFALAALREIGQLDGTLTPAQWKSIHPEEMPIRDEFSLMPPYGYTCPTLGRPIPLPSGAQAIRTAHFYPPKPPATVTMPELRGLALTDATCQLAMIRLEVLDPNVDTGEAFLAAVKSELSKKYPVFDDRKNPLEMIGIPSGAAIWKSGDLKIVAHHDALTESLRYSTNPPGHDKVFVFAKLPPVDNLVREINFSRINFHAREAERQVFHRAVALSGLDAELRQRMDQVYEAVYAANGGAPTVPARPLNRNWQGPMVATLTVWIEAQRSLPPAAQAAALLAAYGMVAAAEDTDYNALRVGPYDERKPQLVLELEKIGARVSFFPYHMARNWLDQAKTMSPEGELLRMVTFDLISARSCDPQEMTTSGEWLLSQSLDEQMARQVHFIVGNAYADTVGLSEGFNPDIDPYDYRNEGASAREKALQHFRAVLATDSTSPMARDAWFQAWSLSAGIYPRNHYTCGDL